MLSEAEIKSIHLKAQAKAAMDDTRRLSLKAWFMVILPITVVLVLVLAFGIQEATGVQVWTLLNEPRDANGRAVTTLPGGRGKVLLARALLGALALGAAGFLYTTWAKQGGAAGFLVGGRIGRQGAFQTERRALQAVQRDAVLAEQLLEQSETAGMESVIAQQKQAAQDLAASRAGAAQMTQQAMATQQAMLAQNTAAMMGRPMPRPAPMPGATAPASYVPSAAYAPPAASAAGAPGSFGPSARAYAPAASTMVM